MVISIENKGIYVILVIPDYYYFYFNILIFVPISCNVNRIRIL